MKSSRRTWMALLVVSVVFAAAAAPAHAGFGDMLKKKAADVVKGKKPAATEAANAESGEIKSRIHPPVTPENIAKFKAGMQYEIAEREKAAKFLASLKSKEDYQKCHMDWVMSSEGQAVSQRYAAAMDGIKTSEDMQKKLSPIAAEMEKAIETKCGPDPGKYGEGWKAQQSRDALGRASDDFAKGQGLEPGTEDYAYNAWKEWVAEFCHYLEKLKKDPDYKNKLAKMLDEGLRIPGQGQGIYFVYTASEAKDLIENCDALMPLIEATI